MLKAPSVTMIKAIFQLYDHFKFIRTKILHRVIFDQKIPEHPHFLFEGWSVLMELYLGTGKLTSSIGTEESRYVSEA